MLFPCRLEHVFVFSDRREMLRWHWDHGFFHVKDRQNLKQLCAVSVKMSSFRLKEQSGRSNSWHFLSFNLENIAAPGAQETVLEVFVGLVRETSSLAMVLSELRTWVGLSAADAVSLFEERVEIEPHWGGRWGLKPSATEVRTCSSQRGPFSIVRHV